ncbi:MAG: efflux RND transporter periplasmic adaptor subunit [Rhizomicrobium sp.]
MSNVRPGDSIARIQRCIPVPLWLASLVILVLFAAVALFLWWPASAKIAEAERTTGGIVVSAEQRRAAGIVVAPLRASPLPRVYRAPGEVKADNYTAGIVSSRVTATVVSRSAKLGDRVVKGQALVTLYSHDVATAQSEFLLARRNLARMLHLKDMIARQLVDEAVVKEQEARSRLESFGLPASDIAAMASGGLTGTRLGQFALAAPDSGSIIDDNFRVGDVVDAGKTLFQIANLTGVWIEAAVSPAVLPQITDDEALVTAGELSRKAKVLQKRDTVDEATRTVGVRLKAENADGMLRPGQFVEVELYGGREPVLNLPTSAVLREPGGRWVVYVRRPDATFAAHPVRVLYAAGDRTAIAGIAPGTPVVMAGAFFVQSEGGKAAFAEEE